MIYTIFIILAVWRLTSLFHAEEGPFRIFERIRKAADRYTNVFKCAWCLSLWIAIPFALYSDNFLVYWLAYSAGAILLEELLNSMQE